MSMHPDPILEIPELTVEVARSAFPKGNRYMKMRDELGTIYVDEQFADLYPQVGQPAEAPWRLALTTIVQFAEDLTDREAADAVRSRIDLKYLLGLELNDASFDFNAQKLVTAVDKLTAIHPTTFRRLSNCFISRTRHNLLKLTAGPESKDGAANPAMQPGLKRRSRW